MSPPASHAKDGTRAEQVNKLSQQICAWAGPVFMVLLGIGYVGFAGLVPPPSPTRSPESIASFVQDHTTRLRIGLTLCMFGAGLLVPWSCAIAVQIKRIEGRWSPMAYTQMTSGSVGALLLVFPLFMLQTAAYRPERSPELVQFASDAAFLVFFGAACLIVVQCLSLALAVFQDAGPEKVFSRWLAYFSLWVAGILGLGSLDVFFKVGPFAWDGIVTFWLDFSAFGAWAVVVTVHLIRAIESQHKDLVGPALGTGAQPAPLGAELPAQPE